MHVVYNGLKYTERIRFVQIFVYSYNAIVSHVYLLTRFFLN